MLSILVAIIVGGPLYDLNQGLGPLQRNTLDVLTTTGHLPADAPFWQQAGARYDAHQARFTTFHPLTAALLQREAAIAAGTATTATPFLNPELKWVQRALKAEDKAPRRFAHYHRFLAALLHARPPVPTSPIGPAEPPGPPVVGMVPEPPAAIQWLSAIVITATFLHARRLYRGIR